MAAAEIFSENIDAFLEENPEHDAADSDRQLAEKFSDDFLVHLDCVRRRLSKVLSELTRKTSPSIGLVSSKPTFQQISNFRYTWNDLTVFSRCRQDL